MPALAFLHTSPAHVAPFTALVARLAPAMAAHHAVDESLLAQARAEGPTASVRAALARALDETAATARARLVVCTCSTLGPLAETLEDRPYAIQRIDRAMARLAVATGKRVAMLAALPSTLAPTRALLEDAAAREGHDVSISEHLAATAWPHFEAGDTPAYLAALREAISAIRPQADVVVLAQASMAAAAHDWPPGAPVLASPELGVKAALEALGVQVSA
ncbi:arylsulfatase [Pseudomonadota bacterium AL_CKDN230030165-1A_HGKHYDSX7]